MKNQTTTCTTDTAEERKERAYLQWKINDVLNKMPKADLERAYNMVLYVYIYSESEGRKTA